MGFVKHVIPFTLLERGEHHIILDVQLFFLEFGFVVWVGLLVMMKVKGR